MKFHIEVLQLAYTPMVKWRCWGLMQATDALGEVVAAAAAPMGAMVVGVAGEGELAWVHHKIHDAMDWPFFPLPRAAIILMGCY